MEGILAVVAARVALFARLSESDIDPPDQHRVQLVSIETIEHSSLKIRCAGDVS